DDCINDVANTPLRCRLHSTDSQCGLPDGQIHGKEVTTVAISTALREVRQRRGLTQHDVGAMAYVTNKLISEVERGNRKLAKDVGRRIAQELDDAKFHLAWAAEAAAGVFVAGPLDGVDRSEE